MSFFCSSSPGFLLWTHCGLPEGECGCQEAQGEGNREPLPSLVTRVIWGFGALTYKSVLMGKGHMSQLHQQNWCHTVELGLWMQAWEGAHGLEFKQEAASRGDEDETEPAGDHRSISLPNRRNGFAALDLLNKQLAQKSKLWSAIYNEKAEVCYEGKEFCTQIWFLAFSTPLTSSSRGACRQWWERDGEIKNWDSGISLLNTKAFLSSTEVGWRWHIPLWIWTSLGHFCTLVLSACYVNSYITCLMI